MALENIANHFSGLDMGALIGGPLTSACDAQMKLAMSTVDFIQKVGFYNDNGVSKTRVADFSFERTVINGQDELGNPVYDKEEVKMAVPLLAIVNVPSLMVQSVDVSFDMEVSSSESSESGTDAEASMSAGASGGWGGFSASVSISGKVATHSANTRKSDNSAKYHVEVHAAQAGTPEGLSRVLDIIAAAVAPSTVESPQAKQDKKIMAQLQPRINEKKKLTKNLELKKLEMSNLKKELDVYKAQDAKAEETFNQEFSDEQVNKALDQLTK
jgi:hypothetical protein